MNWRADWKALSDNIAGLLEAGQFAVATSSINAQDPYKTGKYLLYHANEIFEEIGRFSETYAASIPLPAKNALAKFLDRRKDTFEGGSINAFEGMRIRLVLLSSFRAQLDHALTDFTSIALRASDRAFKHLQRCIVADSNTRSIWQAAYQNGEVPCEKLGGAHMLLHGIWAFKVDGAGGRTDLVFGSPLRDIGEISGVADALVLTEWEIVRDPRDLEKKLYGAIEQTKKVWRWNIRWIRA